jgi:hypothetical protein
LELGVVIGAPGPCAAETDAAAFMLAASEYV